MLDQVSNLLGSTIDPLQDPRVSITLVFDSTKAEISPDSNEGNGRHEDAINEDVRFVQQWQEQIV